GAEIGGSSAGAAITLLPPRIDRTMTGIALASAINTEAMPAMGRNLRDARSPFGGLGEGCSGISGPDVHCTFTSVRAAASEHEGPPPPSLPPARLVGQASAGSDLP